MNPIKTPKKWDYEADIVVVGAGTAGLPAAIEAADAGAKVAVLEILPHCAPSLGLIIVGPAFAGTDVQKELGVEDSPDEYYKDGVELGKGDPEIWRAFADNQLETYYWCQKIGMDIGKDLMAPPAHRRKRGFWKKGADMVRALEKAAKERGIDIKFSHRATRLITDPMTGRVIGVKVKVKDKEEQNFKAKKGVIITTGSFGRNPEMIEEYGPYFINWIPTMCHGHLGDGLKMALDVGAATKDLGRAVSGSFAVDVESKTGLMDFVCGAGGIYVNANGKRFVDESQRVRFYGQIAEEGMKQPGHVWFAIMDDRIKNTSLQPHLLHKAKAVQANTLEELAKKLGVDPVGLKQAVAKYNKDVETLGYDSEFDRRTLYSFEGALVKIDTPPFYGYRCTGSTSSFKGGVKINGKAQVVNHYGEVIPSLYAAGEVTGGFWGHDGTYLPCTMVSASMTFGRIATKNALKEPSC